MSRTLALFAACGLATGLTGAASGQTVINITGATLFESFFVAQASTNDYIDVDGDTFARGLGSNDQLAPGGLPPALGTGQNGQWWMIHYRSTGSVAGLQELIDFGSTFVTNNASGPQLAPSFASKAFLDRTQFIANGVSSSPIFNANNPGGCAVRSNAATLQATFPGLVTEGLRIDMAPLDVPTRWAVQVPSLVPAPTLLPGQAGYGTNPRTSVTAAGAPAGFGNTLATLGPRNLNTGSPDANTIFDTQVAAVPIAYITNLGTGVQQMTQSELRHFFTTGRRLNGENLVASTRESGSGTRNGAMNSLCMDPSWGVGDNAGGLGNQGSVAANEHLLGPLFVPANKIGSGDIESTVRNHRLAIGYSGAERGASGSSAWLTGGRCELLGVRADLVGGGSFVRPTINTILDNNAVSGYIYGGIEQFATLGDPRSAPVNKGGDPGNTNPDMPNVEAAAYLNNITRSVAAFVALPGGSNTLFTPGEFLAVSFVLTSATDFIQDPANPCNMIVNPGLNQPLQDWTRTNNTVFTNAAYSAFGTVTLNGKVPTRQTSPAAVYSDGRTGDYANQGGAAVTYGSNLADRNRISGDFNGDGLRNLNDATEMLKAYRQRNGGPTWTAPAGTGPIAGAPGSDAIIEVLGDFNGDGNFDIKDIRYWADGLAINPSNGGLDRKLGFEAIDNAWLALTGSNNFFGTTKSGGPAYAAGESRFDVAGGAGIAPGWAPVGANGVVDATDAAYIHDQFIGNPAVADGHATWSDLDEAVAFDLSGDMTGDLVVDQADLDAANAAIGGTIACYANCDGSTVQPVLTVADFGCFLNSFAAGDSYANCDGSTVQPVLTVADFGCFLNSFAAGCP